MLYPRVTIKQATPAVLSKFEADEVSNQIISIMRKRQQWLALFATKCPTKIQNYYAPSLFIYEVYYSLRNHGRLFTSDTFLLRRFNIHTVYGLFFYSILLLNLYCSLSFRNQLPLKILLPILFCLYLKLKITLTQFYICFNEKGPY